MAGLNPGSPTDFQYFFEDEVYKINNRGQVVFGLVFDNYEASSTDQDSDVETPIQKGEIRVVWHPTATERVIPERTVGLADRSLMPGDVVRRLIAGKDIQRGYCRDIIMTAALQINGTHYVIPNVASERLQPLDEFTPDLAVCLESWVGTTKAVHSKLRLVSPDGSRLEYPDLESCPLVDYATRQHGNYPLEYYPGQIVTGSLGDMDIAKWLHITKEMKAARKNYKRQQKFAVEAIVLDSVSIHWQCRALSSPPNDTTPPPPKDLIEGEDLKKLKLLNVFEPCTLQVGDRNYLTIGPDDTFVSKKRWRRQQSKYYRNLRRMTHPQKKGDVKSETNSSDHHMPSRPKKRASSTRKTRFTDQDMDIDNIQERDSLDDTLKADGSCPSIKIEVSSEQTQSSQEDATTEEKNDSGISPEPTKEDTSLLNGDSKSSQNALNDDDSDNWEYTSSEGSDTDSGATWSSHCSSAASGRGKRSPQLAVRLLRGKRLKRTPQRQPAAPIPKPGDRVVVETLHTTSFANVVWQDGTIEMNIPSIDLYPIHHLDGQECFPGDFVVGGASNLEESTELKGREYGVVQRVDHHGRTAIVHWYRTYTSGEEPVPQMLNESEVSVYDLKDHPDFQYRPGTVVIRIANFTGEDVNCTAGQVIDNYPSGRVKVWWVDGHTSMCWPQDLYKVTELDAEDNELWSTDGSEASWETQSSVCVCVDPENKPSQPDTPQDSNPMAVATPSTPATNVPRLLEPKVAAHIERGRVAMRKLEDMFAKNPALQSQEIMRRLLNLYKDCRFLDRLMGTSFFHEDHFLGLLERVRERGANTPSASERRVHEQLARLFTPTTENADAEPDFLRPEDASPELVEEMISESSMMPAVGPKFCCRPIVVTNVDVEPMEIESGTPKKQLHLNIDAAQASASESTEYCITGNATQTETPDTTTDPADGKTRNVCYKLCSLINTQLKKAHSELKRRRPVELADFLNNLMKVTTAHEELSYHFSIQYGTLVISTAQPNEKKGEVKFNEATGQRGTETENVVKVASGAEVKGMTHATTGPNTVNFNTGLTVPPYFHYLALAPLGAAPLATSETTPLTTSETALAPSETAPAASETAPAASETAPAASEPAPLATSEVPDIEEADLTALPLSSPPSPREGGVGSEGFVMLESAPEHHRFRASMLQPSEPKSFYSAVKREIKLLRSDLPTGVWVRGYEDRIDLLSVMIAGPKKTPYEDGLFMFDVQLGGEYPRAPPLCLYHSYCNDRLNPNLYVDGKVCVSLLGTWSGRGVEVWGKDSSLLQVIVSLQGLILNDEPYFNEAGYEKQKGTQEGYENSRMYNEMVLLKLVQSMTRILKSPPEPFKEEIVQYCREHGPLMCNRLEGWVTLNADSDNSNYPSFPLVPASRGFCLSLRSSLEAYRTILKRNDIPVPPSTLL